jgi:hypothetical protein
MTSFDVESHVLYALRNAQVKKWPFPHFFVEKVLPEDFYRQFLAFLGKKDDYSSDGARYKGRTFGETVDVPGLEFMKNKPFLKSVAQIFAPEIKTRFSDGKFSVGYDLRLVRDGDGYFIGPHTDAAWKLVSLLFYLPKNDHMAHMGTSLYQPYNEDFRCPGGPHHDFGGFKRIWTAPFLPNTCLGFFKTDNSFHGVEPIKRIGCRRDVLLYNLYAGDAYLPSDKSQDTPSA